jgi:hypothetical protein
MASSEELELARARAKAKLRLQQQQAAPPEDEGLGVMDTIRGGLEAFNQGTTFGFGDEIAGAGRAALDYILPETEADRIAREITGGGDEQSFGERYRMYTDDQRDVADDFKEENAKTALALELAGGLASPLNVLGPGVQAAKNAGLIKTAATVGGRGAAEGALAGLGAAEDLSDPMRDVGGGALVGGVLGGTLGTAGRALTRRNVAEELLPQEVIDQAKALRKAGKKAEADELLDANFTPIHMTGDDTLLTDLAREGLGRVGGAASKLRNQERRFLESAEAAVDVADDAQRALRRSVAERGAVADLPQIRQIETDAARKQAQNAISEAALERKPGLWKATEAERFNPQKMATQLRKYWGKGGDAFKEVKQAKFDTDGELVAILKKHYPEADVDETLQATMKGGDILDLRNQFAIKANKGGPSAQGAENRAFKEEIDNWMIRKMGGKRGPDGKITGSAEAMRYGDELEAYGNYKAYRDALKGQDPGRFNVKKLAKGKGTLGEEGLSFGQDVGIEAKKGLKKATKDLKKADLDAKEGVEQGLKKARDELSEMKRRSAPKASGLSELFTTRALGAAADMGVRGLTLPAGLGLGQALASKGGQRALAGQTAAQKLLQDNETAKLLTQLMRQSTSRFAAGE